MDLTLNFGGKNFSGLTGEEISNVVRGLGVKFDSYHNLDFGSDDRELGCIMCETDGEALGYFLIFPDDAEELERRLLELKQKSMIKRLTR